MAVKTVFLSSTAKDLRDYRDAAAAAIEGLGYKCEKMEVFGASSAPTADLCIQRVQSSDLYVGVLAYAYGSCPEGESRSYTEIEFDAAVGANLDCLLFIADAKKKFAWDPDEVDPADLARQRSFKERASRGRPAAFFGTPDELAKCVVQAIHHWERERAPAAPSATGRPAVSPAVESFRKDFEKVQEGIRDLHHLKTLHDQLHSLPKNCLGPLLEQVKRFPEVDLDQVDGADLNLGRAIITLKSAVESRSTHHIDTDWVATLEQSRSDLQPAIDENDAKRFRRSVSGIRTILETQPFVINSAMKSIAKGLRLKDLVRSLGTILDEHASKLPEGTLSQLRSSIELLASLSDRLDSLVSEHDAWQMVDKELRPIEANLKSDFGIMQLKQSWPYLKELAEPLVAGNAQLLAEGNKLDAALEGGEPLAIENSFKRFLSRAFFAFLAVDTALKDFCGNQLSEIKDPTALLAEVR
jgi:hypothetical protein